MTAQPALKVRSHVGRDLLQSSQLFRHEHAVIWEYVANGLEYKDPETKPSVVVEVDPKAKTIRIRDNGRGMLMSDLQSYFQMHGENRDRKQGRPGRGLFGTGKSAAFGIATSLIITTVRNGLRSKVHLTKDEILTQTDGNEIPVRIIERESPTTQPNGTLVEIDNVLLKQIDIGGIILYTTLLTAALASYVANEPSPILMLLPTEADCRDFTVSDLEPTFEATPVLRGLLSADADESGRNTLLSRRFAGGSLKIVAAKAPRNLRRHAATTTN